MRVFVTGATGFVGSAVVSDLLAAGHQVLGLVRSDKNAAALAATGAEVHRGDLTDLDSLRAGAAKSDGVIHTAFIHDFSQYKANSEIDVRAIAAMGEVLAGSNRPLIVSSGVARLAQGRPATENDVAHAASDQLPRASEAAVFALADKGVRASAVRLAPTVHDKGDHGFVPGLIAIARAKGVSGYVDEGLNRWPAVHRLDAGRVYRLIVEQPASAGRYHAIAEEGIATRDIAAAIGRGLNLPVVSVPRDKATEHFGFLGLFFGADCPTSAALTRQKLNWTPAQPGLLADLAGPHYFAQPA